MKPKIIKKSEIIALLKSLGYGFVKIETPKGYRIYKDLGGTKYKGIGLVSFSPLDVTDVKSTHMTKVLDGITSKLIELGVSYVGSPGSDIFIANAGDKKHQIVFCMYTLTFPTYSLDMRLDLAYNTVYCVFDFDLKLFG